MALARRVAADGRRQKFDPPAKLERWRTWVALSALLLLFGVLLGRGLYLRVYKETFLKEQGKARYARTLKLEANRGTITDRNGELLAISTPVQSVWASPRSIILLPPGKVRPNDWEPENEKDPTPISVAELGKLAKLLGVTPEELAKKLGESRKSAKGEEQKADFVWLKRHVTPAEAKAVKELNLPGVYTQPEYRRYYPAGEMMAHIVGFTDIDGKGQEGFELTREAMLAGKPGSRNVIRDRRGHIVEDTTTIIPPRDGEKVELSIDRRIQYIAYRELKSVVESTKAIGGGVVVLDARTGEVLALANAPSYNPNSRAVIDPARKRNRALTDVYEPGSTMKPFTIAAAMEAGKIRPSTVLPTGKSLSIGPNTIHDDHASGAMSVEQIIQKSSNIGSAKIALMLEREYHWAYLRNLGFGEPPRTGFPGEVAGRVRPWKNWVPIDQATMAYGHGISVSLMQMARAYQLFATDGEIRPVTFTRLVAPLPGKRVVKPETALAVRKMLEMVTQPGGTATRAQVVGYRVAGKTGTATKLENGVYVKKYVASFVGFAPVSDPRLIVAVMIDEPQGGYYGGLVAAPVFSNVVAGSLRMLGVSPDAPTGNTIGPAGHAEEDVKEET
ncbi:cell division protein FtsI (penicillin-binding protein 3) [Formivibrio citricus]|uniref:Peptidoglycan D,D-transpeptidase FtsI n=1 Tax=Formivibrio citricus TaxID=83765 RepID=A0A1I4VNP2_9NEIS|nr:penicillin-binding protein 2 [Formivibrio citricus]SFN02719.1 cell division protein FtsI (penicillin-binding protein 3) [Formivibrio citricus]